MILDRHSKTLDGRVQARAFGHCPAFKRSVNFQTKVVMQATSPMFLHDELQSVGGTCRLECRAAFTAPRLWGFREVALAVVCIQTFLNPRCILAHAHAARFLDLLLRLDAAVFEDPVLAAVVL